MAKGRAYTKWGRHPFAKHIVLKQQMEKIMLNTFVKTQIRTNELVAKVKSFRSDEEGASLVEYSILIGLISAAVIGAIIIVGGFVTTTWTGLGTTLTPPAG